MVRTQLYLDDDLHQRLKSVAAEQGLTVSDLVREAVVRTLGEPSVDERLRTLEGIAGLRSDRADLGPTDEYVRRLRRDTSRAMLDPGSPSGAAAVADQRQ